MDKLIFKCENCDCEINEDNCSYEDGICDDCYEANCAEDEEDEEDGELSDENQQ